MSLKYGRGTIVKHSGVEYRIGWGKYDDGFKQTMYIIYPVSDLDEKFPVTPVPESALEFVRLKEN